MAHQSPLIAIPRKTTTDTDWAGPIRSTIAHSFGESPDAYAEEISVLQRCRQDAVRGAGSDATARDLLYKYFGQLELLELRFAEVKVSFGWNDAFTNKLTSQTSLAYEKASIIHLLAAVLSSLAATQSRADPEGLKRAYFNSRATAGMLTYINENFLHAPSTDLSREVVHFLINLMLVQATEVFMEKLVDEKKAPSLVARTANQVTTMYGGLMDEMREFQGKGVFDRTWMSLVQLKQKYFSSFAQYQRGLADAKAGKHGIALVRYKIAEEHANEAYRLAQNFNYSFDSATTPTLPHDAGSSMFEITKAHKTICGEAKTQAVRDNDLIYHDILPSEASLPAIEKLPPSTPITIQEVYGNADVSKLIGPDIFSRLIPLAVHESASVYSEEKAKLARGEVERVELSEVEVRAALEHLGLPALVNQWRALAEGDDADAEIDLSPEVVQVAIEVGQPSTTDARVRQLEGERSRCERELQELAASLETESRECERMRAKYAPNFTQAPSGPQTAHLRNNIASNQGSLQSAAASDSQIVTMWREIQPDLAVLGGGEEGLRAQARDIAMGKTAGGPQVPAGMSLLDLDDEEQVKPRMDPTEQEELRQAAQDASEKLERLNKIRRERDEVLKDLKEKIQNDDVSNLLLLNRRTQNVEPQLFATELEKFRPYQNRIAAAVQASKSNVAELEALVAKVGRGKGVKERQRGVKERTKRLRDWERRLERAGASHREVVDGLGKGLGFYESLDKVIMDLKREVNQFVSNRNSERNRIVSDLETRNRLGSASPPAPAPPARGLDTQLAGLNLGSPSPTAGYPQPPKATSPAASHDPYNFGGQAGHSSVFSTESPSGYNRSLPPPPPPSKPSYPSYPAFPSAPSNAPAQSPSSYSSSSSPYPAPPSGYPQRTSSYQSPPSTQAYPPPPSSTSSAYPPPPPSRPSHQPPPQQSYGGYGAQSPPPQPAYPSSQYTSQYPTPPSQPPTQPAYGGYPAPSQPQRQASSGYPSYPAPPAPNAYGQPQQQYQQPPPPQQQQQYQQPPYGQPPQHQYGGYQPPQQGYR